MRKYILTPNEKRIIQRYLLMGETDQQLYNMRSMFKEHGHVLRDHLRMLTAMMEKSSQ